VTTFIAPDIERVRATAASLVDEYRLPGMSIGVLSSEGLLYSEGFGYAEIESARPQGPRHRQRIGSITKTMVGLCAMALVEEGKLRLNERAVDRLPDINFTGPAETVLIRHLMTHTNGIGEAPRMDQYLDTGAALWSNSVAPIPVTEAYADGIHIDVPAGAKWSYANHAFALLGEIISRIEGNRIEEILRDRIFDPLAMANTDCYDLMHPDLTVGYHRVTSHDDLDVMEVLGNSPPEETPVDGYNIRGDYVYVGPRAAGAVQSTIHDMAKYASALLRKGAGIVSPETFDRMTAPQWRPDDRLLSLGLTFMRDEQFGLRSIGHGGGVSGGWNTHIDLFPSEDLAVLVHINIYFDKSEEIFSRIIQAVLNAPDPDFSGCRTDPAILASAPGVYEPPEGFLTSYRIIRSTGRLQITERDGELYLRARRGPWREGVRLAQPDPRDPAFFVLDTGAPDPPRLAFVRDENGKPTTIRMSRMNFVRNGNLGPWTV
jgi:CubicO group peptidase (beta-lactamase class C family)